MPSITREQALKLNAQAPAPWKFDVKYYVIHGEKTLVHTIELDSGKFLEARLYFSENHEKRQNEFCSWTVPAGNYHICLHLSTYSPSSVLGCYHSFGLGKFINLDNAQHTKRNYKDLCKIALTLTDDDLLTYAGVKEAYDAWQLLQMPV